MRTTVSMIVAAALCFITAGAWAQDASDAVAAQDKLNLKVLEWLPAKGEYREWTAVGGIYTVSANGTISIPFVGDVTTGSKSPSDLSREIAGGLQRGLSLPTQPEVSLEFVSRAPVFVIGAVETPGRIEFSPGMTVLKAVASAGGFYRGGGGTLRLERDVINAESSLEDARQTIARLKAQIARLKTELVDGLAVTDNVPPTEAEELKPFVAEEQGLLDARRQARQSRIESLRSRRQLAIDQLKAIEEKSVNLTRQAELTKSQLGDIQSLVGKGLTVASRALELERTMADIEGRRLDLEIAKLAASLEVNEAERDEGDLLTTFRTEVSNDLQLANAQLAKTTIELDRANGLLREASVIAPEKLMDRAGNVEVGIRFFRDRTVDGTTTTLEIGKNEIVQAGDTIQVQLNLDEGRPAGDVASIR